MTEQRSSSLNLSLLRDAIARGDTEAAARLLATRLVETEWGSGQDNPLCATNATPELVHAIRLKYQREPISGFRKPAVNSSILGKLERHGIVQLIHFVPEDVLARLRSQFDALVSHIAEKLAKGHGTFIHHHEEDHYWPDNRVFISNNAFRWSPELLINACSSTVLNLCRSYFGKPVHVQRAQGVRYLEGGESGQHMFQWHHDLEGHRLKLMILLTPVTETDHAMGYVRGSHRIEHNWDAFQRNRLALDYCRAHLGSLDLTQALGMPGDAYLFDSNGAHIAHRRATGRRRDVFIVEYSGDTSNVFGATITPEVLRAAGPEVLAATSAMRRVRPRWKCLRESTPRWHRTLHSPDQWVARF